MPYADQLLEDRVRMIAYDPFELVHVRCARIISLFVQTANMKCIRMFNVDRRRIGGCEHIEFESRGQDS